MKNLLYICFTCFLFASCSKENLYEFKDLTSERDYIYMVKLYAQDTTKSMEFSIEKSQTNGYDQVVTQPYSFGTTGNERSYTAEFAVKAYKKNGVLVTPRENIKGVIITFYEVRSANILRNMVYQHTSHIAETIYVGYDFETGERLIEFPEN